MGSREEMGEGGRLFPKTRSWGGLSRAMIISQCENEQGEGSHTPKPVTRTVTSSLSAIPDAKGVSSTSLESFALGHFDVI